MTVRTKGLVLAAGLGTRLRPLTDDVAKPALPVLGIPTVWYSLLHLARSLQLSEIAVNISHAPDTMKKVLDDPTFRSMIGIPIYISDETSEILGSSGALWKLKDWVGNSTLAVVNADCICPLNWRRLEKQHQRSKGLMTIHVRKHESSPESYTDIEIDAYSRVISFREKTSSGTMFSGAYFIEPEALKRLPAGKSELKNTLLDPLSKERILFACSEEVSWLDTGSISTFAQTQFELLRQVPDFRDLVSHRMKEVRSGSWIPIEWESTDGITLVSPCVLNGNKSQWMKANSVVQYGPNFIGLEATLKEQVFSNCISTKNFCIPL